MKTLVVGDIHTKIHIVDNVRRCLRKGFNVVLVGDYVDDWFATPQQNELVIKELIRLKEEFTDQLALLIGNHELSEAFGLEYYDLRCAGFNPEVADKVSGDIRWMIKKGWLRVCTRVGKYMISHAGLTVQWFDGMTDEDIEHLLHQSTHSSLKKLNMCSSARGGKGPYSGPLWTDKSEFLVECTPREPKQIMGHTPVASCTRYTVEMVDLWFIDTFSTDREGKKIGDETILVFEGDEPKVTTFKEVLGASNS